MSFKEEAVRRAEQAGYYPAAGQRRVDWETAEAWAEKVQEPDFSWRAEADPGTDGYIVIGENNAVASGQHRILGGLMGNNPVPEEAITRLAVPLPTQPWDSETGE
jgi:hypothetical protein